MTIAEYFADQLNRYRPLSDDEVGKLVTVQCGRRRRWTDEDDRTLLRLSRRLPAHVVASRLDRTPHSVRTRIRDLKRRIAHGVQR